jgi:LacI family transcriptional regulator
MSEGRKNHRNVTIIDVARESGVSYSTVSRVLNGFEFVKDSTRQKVLEAAERLGYVANLQARSLAGGRSNIIGLLVPAIDNGYIVEITRGIDEELARANYELMLYTTHRHRNKESLYVNTIANGLTDGLILLIPLIQAEYLYALRERDFPHVMIDQTDPDNLSTIVDATNWQGAYEATEYLIKQGHTKIAHIVGLQVLNSARERLEGYKAALNAHGIPYRKTYVVDGDFTHPKGYVMMQKLLQLPDRPTAVFAANDLSAFGAMQAIHDACLTIPDDISIIGFDDIPEASMLSPKLTTMSQPLYQMGRESARLLLELIESTDRPPRRITLATRLIERESVRKFTS